MIKNGNYPQTVKHLKPLALGPGVDLDITKLKTPWRGKYFDLYVMLDIFSRKVIHWEVHATETGELAKAFMENAVIANGGARPGYIHADNGTSITSKPVADLLSDLRITKSHSRPHVSNDNPYSESNFKTPKYCPVFPGSFAAIGEAAAFCRIFFDYYNNEHRHSGIGLHTPQSVHDGTAVKIRERRQEVLDAFYAEHPERFRSRPVAPKLDGAENLCHLGKGSAEHGWAFGMRRAGLGPAGGGVIFGLRA